jgi:hypothetical protein
MLIFIFMLIFMSLYIKIIFSFLFKFYLHAQAFSISYAGVRYKQKFMYKLGHYGGLVLSDYANSLRQSRFNCCEDAEITFIVLLW